MLDEYVQELVDLYLHSPVGEHVRGHHARLMWAVSEFRKAHPSIGPMAAYQALEDSLEPYLKSVEEYNRRAYQVRSNR